MAADRKDPGRCLQEFLQFLIHFSWYIEVPTPLEQEAVAECPLIVWEGEGTRIGWRHQPRAMSRYNMMMTPSIVPRVATRSCPLRCVSGTISSLIT